MRLLLITKDFPPDVGGIQTYCLELAKRFASSCESFAVVAPRVPDCTEVDRTLPFDVVRISSSRSGFATAVLASLPALKRRYRFNAVLGAQWQASWAALVSRSVLGPHAVCAAVHGREVLTMHYANVGGARVFDAARRYTLARVDRLFPVSHYTLGLVEEQGIAFRSAEVVPNGCNAEWFAPRGGEEKRRELGLNGHKVMLSLCRLVPNKGVDTVIAALPAIAQTVPEVRLLIAGDGEDRGRLEAMVDRLGVRARVRFLGRVPNEEVPALFTMADVFVMASREERPCVEGFGLVFLEAGACETAVVGARSGGIPDAILEGKTGFLVSPAAPQELADAVTRLLSDPELAARFGRTARARILHEHTWDHVALRLQGSISGLLS